ncbi:hypothetical protein CDAR_258001 [Caerostris darwini]|uniref:Uncharacterized protein n=1 Tax=Caerostris darwini TaxID=1538125 RepID=A0AAV4WXT0_9ARAC|nr:hypothetical protein CDAR_258001 [Caerostris darwini]
MRTISHELRTYPHLMGQAHLYDSIVREIWQAVPTVQRNPHIIHDWDTNPNCLNGPVRCIKPRRVFQWWTWTESWKCHYKFFFLLMFSFGAFFIEE